MKENQIFKNNSYVKPESYGVKSSKADTTSIKYVKVV